MDIAAGSQQATMRMNKRRVWIIAILALLAVIVILAEVTRLFLSGPVQGGAAQNWNQYSICGRQWYVCSWQGVPATLPWIEILANHLRAFR